MTTTDVKSRAADTSPGPTTPWKVATAVLAVISIALALVLATTTGFIGGQSDIEAIAADYNAAWVDLDAEGVASFFAENGSIRFVTGTGTFAGLDAITTYAAGYPVGSVLENGTMSSDGAFVVSPYHWEFGGTGGEADGISVLQFDGDKILTHYIFLVERTSSE